MNSGATAMNVINLESQLVNLLERLEEREIMGASAILGAGMSGSRRKLSVLEQLDAAERDQETSSRRKMSMMAEVRTLELWRSVIAECLATVFYVFLVCGSYSPWMGKGTTHEPQARIVVAMVSGFSAAVLIHSFGQVSGGHINPAVSLGFAITRKISPLRAAMFILAQLGGGIAGAALLYGATSSGYSGNLGATELSGTISVWQGLAVEFLLTLVLVFVIFSSMNPYRRASTGTGSPAVVIGLAYLACTLVGFPLTGASMNPARSLGPAFVMNKWNSHWVYWVAPILGASVAALIYEYIFNPRRTERSKKDSVDADLSSVASDEDGYDECSKVPPRYNYNALRPQHYDQYRPTNTHSPLGYSTSVYGPSGAASVYNASVYNFDSGFGKEEIYSGSKSMYAKSPPLPRTTSLNRSQSVYTRPAPPRTDNYSRNLAQQQASQQAIAKSTGNFTGLLQQEVINQSVPQRTTSSSYSKNNRNDSLYVTSKPGLIKPEPVYGISSNYSKQPDSGDSTYSTYRGSGSYSSSRSSGNSQQQPPPLPAARSHRAESQTPNSIISAHSALTTPNSMISYHSPNPQY